MIQRRPSSSPPSLLLASLLCLSVLGSFPGCAGTAGKRAVAAPSQAPAVRSLAELEWLVGRWRGQAENGAPIEERWEPPIDGTMSGHSSFGEVTETLRIEARPDAIVYVASPSGQASAGFVLTELRGDPAAKRWHAVFENPDHDFPQRLSYAREGDVLRAVVDTLDGRQRLVFSWRLHEKTANMAQ